MSIKCNLYSLLFNVANNLKKSWIIQLWPTLKLLQTHIRLYLCKVYKTEYIKMSIKCNLYSLLFNVANNLKKSWIIQLWPTLKLLQTHIRLFVCKVYKTEYIKMSIKCNLYSLLFNVANNLKKSWIIQLWPTLKLLQTHIRLYLCKVYKTNILKCL